MKVNKKLVFFLILGLAYFFSGCNDSGNNLMPDVKSPSKMLRKAAPKAQFMQQMQLGRLEKAGLNSSDIDAYFTIGWYPAYDFDGNSFSDEIYSFGYAGAYSNKDYRNFDMGDVSVNYGSDKTDFYKHTFDFFYTDSLGNNTDSKDVFYDLYKYDMIEDDMDTLTNFEEAKVPYVSGANYIFKATGSDEFSPIEITVNSPGEFLEITSPAKDAEVDLNNDLKIQWNGGNGAENTSLSVFPELDWDNISDQDYITLMNDIDSGIFVELTAGQTEYVVSKKDLERFNHQYVKGLFIDIYSYNLTKQVTDKRNVIAELHFGNYRFVKIKK